ncbi:MAG: CBS domain-containing protein [Cyanobacteria bacterium J06627_28]
MLTVADIMTKEVFTIRSSAKVVQAIALMQEKKVRSLIVERETGSGVYGILTGRDIVYNVTAKCADPSNIMVGEIMKRPCIALDSSFTISEAAQRLAEAGVQRAPVIKDNQLQGVVSVTDIIMKSNVDAVDLPCDLSAQIEVALRHCRLGWSEETQLAQESKTAVCILEELN